MLSSGRCPGGPVMEAQYTETDEVSAWDPKRLRKEHYGKR